MPPKAATSPAEPVNLALTDAAARQLANATRTTAQLDTITPWWLVRLLHLDSGRSRHLSLGSRVCLA
jgi:hypothetical protein